MGVLDHLEQRLRRAVALHVLPVDGPRRVEDLVPAVLGVGLREHHQFDVAGVAAELAEAFAQVFDLVLRERQAEACVGFLQAGECDALDPATRRDARSEEHTSELQSLMRISYAVFCLKKKNKRSDNSENQRNIS